MRANPQAREIAKRDKIDIRYYSIIYKVTEDIEALMLGLLDPTYKETFLGNAQIREVFRITKVGNVAGCMVTEGIVKRGAKVRLLRDNVVIHEGTLKTLQALQGRGPRGPARLRVRHGVRELRRHQGRRRDRVLRRRGSPVDPVRVAGRVLVDRRAIRLEERAMPRRRTI